MISVQEAKNRVLAHCNRLPAKIVSLENAANLVLAEDVFAPFDIPAFYQSSMDGYAIAFESLSGTNRIFPVSGESAAGGKAEFRLLPGEVCRIFTGAPLPDGADTVVIQERTEKTEGGISIEDHKIEKAQFVRAPGAEIRANQKALPAGHTLSPASISYLGAIGITEVSVYPSPVVTVIVTGNEFQQRGTKLQKGKVFESNSLGLTAALNQAGITDVKTMYAADTLEDTVRTLKNACIESDLVLLTGGVSVGDYDFVVAAAEACAIEKIFHKINQKPGKPLFFGVGENATVFGLPGNPSSVLTCFYEYVLPALQQLTGRKLALAETEVTLNQAYQKPPGLTHFLKAWCENESVMALSAQESFKLSSFATANCLVVLPEETTLANSGDKVLIHWLP